MGYPSQTQRCWRNGNVFRRRPRTETIARLEKWVIVGSSVLACLVDSGLKPNPKPSTKCNLICNYVMWWQTDPLSGFCRSFSSLVCFGGSIDVSKHWNKPGPTLQALTVNMHTRNGKWNAFIWEVEEEFSCYVIQQAELIAKPISQLLYIFSAIQDWSNEVSHLKTRSPVAAMYQLRALCFLTLAHSEQVWVSHQSAPGGYPAWETQTATPQSALITTQFPY